MIPFAQINAVALSQLPALCAEWLPGGKQQGSEWVCGGIDGSRGRSLSVNLSSGKWADFADPSLKGGDPISLYACINTNNDQGRAARELGARLGVTTDTIDPAPPARIPSVEEWVPGAPPHDAPAPPLHNWDRVYTYVDAEGRPERYVLRRDATETDRKKILPLTWGTLKGKVGWHHRHPAAPRSLYQLDRVLKARNVLICEGEKAADAAQKMLPRHTVTTWTAGTGNVANTDWSVLAGKHVVIWPDNDEPGRKAASEISVILSGIALTVRTVNVEDTELGGDAADLRVDDVKEWLRDHVGPVTHGTAQLGQTPAAPVVTAGRRSADLEPIQVRAGEIDLAATAGERALLASHAPIYQRGDVLVRPGTREVTAANQGMTKAACLVEITQPTMVEMLCHAVEWQKWNKRQASMVQIDPPREVASIIMGRSGVWGFKTISGVITTPTLRPDGSLLDAPGYDPTTRLFHVADPTLDLKLMAPSRKAAEIALRELCSLLEEFPFSTPVDRAVALSAIITSVVRGMMPVAPLFAFRANAPGSGKSFLVDVASVIATGRVCPVTSAGYDEEEMEKRLAGLLLAGYPILSLDNVNGELGGDLLCQAVERPSVRIRALGTSVSTEIENRSVIFATGNGLCVKGDMTRRTVVCTLDAAMERPELRKFQGNPIRAVSECRGRYVAACLTIVRSWMASGAQIELPPLASFESWSATVRSALVWLGEADPCVSMETAREFDPEMSAHREVLGLVSATMGVGENRWWTIRELEEAANRDQLNDYGDKTGLKNADLLDALVRVAGRAGRINSKSLGRWLMLRLNRPVDGLKLVERGHDRNKVRRWAVVSC